MTKNRIAISILLLSLLACLLSSVLCIGGYAQPAGTMQIKDTATAQEVMLTSARPHGKDGAIVEFDLLSDPQKLDDSGTENNRFRLFAGMPDNFIGPPSSVSLAGTGLQAASLAIDPFTNKITSYSNGLVVGSAATLTGSAENAVTAEDTWNYTTQETLFKGGNTYRITFDFTPDDYTDSLTIESKTIGGEEFSTILTVSNYVDPFTGTASADGVNTGDYGYAGILFEDISVEIDNFHVYEKNGITLAKEGFNGEFVPGAAGKVSYGSLLISAYNRTGVYGLFATEQCSIGAPQIVVGTDLVAAGTAGADSIGGVITLSENETIYNTALGAFDPYAYITSITDSTVIDSGQEANITEGFADFDKLSVKYYQEDGTPADGIAQNVSGTYFVEYCYTDTAGNRDFAVLKVIASPETVYFTVSGTVTSGGVPVENALIKYDSEQANTDSSGSFSFQVEGSADVNAVVSADGYYEASFAIVKISKNEVVNISLIPDGILWFEPSDTAITTLSTEQPHSEHGYILEFDLLEGLQYTGNKYVGVSFFAGADAASISTDAINTQITNESAILFELNVRQTGLSYLPIIYGTYGSELAEDENVVVKGEAGEQTLYKTDAGKGQATGVMHGSPFAAAGSFRVTFNFDAATFTLEKKVDGVYTQIVSVEGIKDTGAGYGGIHFGELGAKIDNVKFTELTGAPIAQSSFDKSLQSGKNALAYEGLVIGSVVTPLVQDSATTYREIKDVFTAGKKGQDVDCGAPQLTLNQDEIIFNINDNFDAWQYLTSVQDAKNSVNVAQDFEKIGVAVAIYCGGEVVSGITQPGMYTVNYKYTDKDGNSGYANLTVEAYKKTIIGLALKGDYPVQMEIGSRFDVTGKKLVITYNDDSREEIDLTSEMIKLDTSAVGNKFISLVYDGFTQSNYDCIEVVTKLITVKGKVTNNGSAVSDVTVAYGTGRTVTDASGEYSFQAAEGTKVEITFSKDGYISVAKTIDSVSTETILDIAISREQITVSGTVSCPDGMLQTRVYYGDNYVDTDEQGNYSFTVEKGSSVQIRVEQDGYKLFSQQLDALSQDTELNIILEVEEKAGGCQSSLEGYTWLGVLIAAGVALMATKRKGLR